MIRIQTATVERHPGISAREAERAAVRACLDALDITEPLGHHSSGAPYIEGRPDLVISISHCREMACVALGEPSDGPFGVDVEDVTRPQLERVAPRIMTPDELSAARQYPDGLARAWTAKEATYKALHTLPACHPLHTAPGCHPIHADLSRCEGACSDSTPPATLPPIDFSRDIRLNSTLTTAIVAIPTSPSATASTPDTTFTLTYRYLTPTILLCLSTLNSPPASPPSPPKSSPADAPFPPRI